MRLVSISFNLIFGASLPVFHYRTLLTASCLPPPLFPAVFSGMRLIRLFMKQSTSTLELPTFCSLPAWAVSGPIPLTDLQSALAFLPLSCDQVQPS